jgi:Rab GDP dissociation inhibitor
MVSFAHQVAAKNKYVAMISATVETDNPKSELSQVLSLIGRYDAE